MIDVEKEKNISSFLKTYVLCAADICFHIQLFNVKIFHRYVMSTMICFYHRIPKYPCIINCQIQCHILFYSEVFPQITKLWIVNILKLSTVNYVYLFLQNICFQCQNINTMEQMILISIWAVQLIRNSPGIRLFNISQRFLLI